MLIVISPAKTLDFEPVDASLKSSKPTLLKQSAELVEQMRQFDSRGLQQLMGVSEKIASLNVERYQSWHTPFNRRNAKQAIMAFRGDVYTGLDADSFKADDFEFAQEHLRILSGLYGLLKPLDLIQPYRLEMGTRIETSQGGDLYTFWRDTITPAVNRQLKKIDSDTLVNLASNEYFSALDGDKLKARVCTPVFKDYKNGKYKIVSFFAKKARGQMSAYAIQKKITDAEQLKRFRVDGYKYDKASSTDTEWVFLRKQA